ncbi:hypothetical protein THAOC_33477 [Thalassiosira oceanica]|uniref:Carboxypeptidase n=1 Tax=Thalassiosira oceanica TaxID=159749 RepID=K0RFS0_THAOC|nr:hypothetical protein THAOC_33477 [Thalassiosira oceanica]|eukprot:EJK47786.1 hypothetical protein THAOC_33477 [Thalassiosira oceanica]
MKILFSALRVATVTAFTSSSSRSSVHARQQVSSKMTATLSEPSTAIKFADESSNFKELKRTSSARGKQLAVLATIAHEKSVDPRIGELLAASTKDLEACDKEIEDLDDAKRILELEKADYQKRICIPKELAAKKAELEASAYSAWVKARQDNDFAAFAPALGDCFDLAKEIAALKRGDNDISLYSQMLDEFEMGMQGTRIDELFAEVQSALVPFIARIRASEDKPSLDPLRGKFDVDAQKKVCLDIVKSLGYDASHGRLDVSVHPFTMSLSGSDVRITSRFSEEEWYQGLAGAIHEGGHAMYEQNLQGSDLSIDSALSMGVHESQSLFWERHIGKCPAFFQWATPMLNDQLKLDASADDLYSAVNAIDFSNFIRVEADELTYPLHVILRYTIERQVVSGELSVNEIPSTWNKMMKDFLDVEVTEDSKGCLQDIHWSMGAIGYFPTYLLGAMMSAQLHHYCTKDLDVGVLVAKGEFKEIREWLTNKIHKHGKRYKSLDDLLLAETGEILNPKYFVEYLTKKYSELYKIE